MEWENNNLSGIFVGAIEGGVKIPAVSVSKEDGEWLLQHMEKKKKEDAPVKAKTSHTLNKVPFIIYGADVELKQDEQLGLSNVAATVADLLEVAPNEHWNESIIKK